MKSFLLCYILIGCIFSMYIKWGIDTIGIDSVMEQLDEKPKDFDPNNPLIQFLIIVLSILLWPFIIMLSINDKNGE